MLLLKNFQLNFLFFFLKFILKFSLGSIKSPLLNELWISYVNISKYISNLTTQLLNGEKCPDDKSQFNKKSSNYRTKEKTLLKDCPSPRNKVKRKENNISVLFIYF